MATVTNPLFCTQCGTALSADDLARFGDQLICPSCKEGYTQRLREGVAPAVARTYAGFWIRAAALIIDSVILMVVNIGLQFALVPASLSGDPEAMAANPTGMITGLLFLNVLILAIAMSYEGYFLSQFGATPGKMAVHLKVVRPDGGPISFGRGAGRYFAKLLSSIILCIGFLMAAFDSEKRALHDMICDTRVIRA